jgi:hypothetical protein
MPSLKNNIKALLRDFPKFCRYGSALTLRNYQVEPAKAIIDSIINKKGYSFVIIFPRQSGKNELQAQIQTYLLTIYSMLDAEIVSISPTWKPQADNAMRRLERVLSNNLITRDMWDKHKNYIYRIGKARVYFLSGSPSANVVGATANILLSVDEAQDILIDKFDKEIAPMAASTNATRVFWGTAWTSNTLLAREYALAKSLQEQDGHQRVWRLTADDVALEVPDYGRFVSDQVSRLGRHHPMVKTQYYSEDIDSQGGLFPPSRIALLYGVHPCHYAPVPDSIYVMTLDVAGEDESESDLGSLPNLSRDFTALTIAQVDLSSLQDPGVLLPTYRIVFRKTWSGIKHTNIYFQILSYAESFSVRYLVVDSTGVGAGLTSFLSRPLGDKVIPFVFNARTKSDLGWSFLALVDSGRLKDYALPENPDPDLLSLQKEYFKQLEYCKYEILPGPQKQIRWSVPDGTRDPASGEYIHDDLMISAAMLSLLDDQPWSVPVSPQTIKAPDPLDDMKGF